MFVAIQYRVGIFGWPYGAEAAKNGAANLGLRDIIYSLKWVQQNIGAFGGDPAKVGRPKLLCHKRQHLLTLLLDR